MNSADTKRMILMDSEKTGIRKRQLQLIAESKTSIDEQIQIGNALESLTQHSGWPIVEAYICRIANVSDILLEDNPTRRLEARGLVLLMQWMDQQIKLKNELMRKKADEKE